MDSCLAARHAMTRSPISAAIVPAGEIHAQGSFGGERSPRLCARRHDGCRALSRASSRSNPGWRDRGSAEMGRMAEGTNRGLPRIDAVRSAGSLWQGRLIQAAPRGEPRPTRVWDTRLRALLTCQKRYGAINVNSKEA